MITGITHSESPASNSDWESDSVYPLLQIHQILLCGIKEQTPVVSIERRRKLTRIEKMRGEGWIVVKAGEYEMIPPPPYLFPELANIFRRMARKIARQKAFIPSVFKFSILETGTKTEIRCEIDYDITGEEYMKEQLYFLLREEYERLRKEKEETELKMRQLKVRKFLFFFTGLVAIILPPVLTYFLK